MTCIFEEVNKITGKKGNNYNINGDEATIELKRRNKESLYTKVDIEDLHRILSFPFTWHSAYDPVLEDYYACATEHYDDIDGVRRNRTILLHMFIMKQEHKSGKHVDHINHNSLDNRKENLRVSEVKNNSTNREHKNINNKSGYRNVIKLHGWYQVQIQINGKNTPLAKFKDVHEAGIFAEKMREKYYGEFAGGS